MSAFALDSSALTKAYVQEVGTAWVLGLFDVVAGHDLYVSRLTGIEVTSALVRHAPLIPTPTLQKALADLRQDLANTLDVIELTAAQSDEAIRLAEKHRLRAYDAVQLACALEVAQLRRLAQYSPLTFVSADLALNAAAQAEGLQVDDPNSHP